MDRESRRFSHQKGNKIDIIFSPPAPHAGADGDMKLEISGAGAILYVKGQGRWFKFYPNANTIDGWHGSLNKIRLFPSNFMPGSAVVSAAGDYFIYHTQGYGSFNNSGTTNHLVANVAIPLGFKAIGVKIYGIDISGSGSDPSFGCTSHTLSGDGTDGVILPTTAWNNEGIFSEEVIGSDERILQISITGIRGTGASDPKHGFRGGYVNIVPVLTPERVLSGSVTGDSLGREA